MILERLARKGKNTLIVFHVSLYCFFNSSGCPSEITCTKDELKKKQPAKLGEQSAFKCKLYFTRIMFGHCLGLETWRYFKISYTIDN